MHVAAEAGQLEVLQLLVDHGGDVREARSGRPRRAGVATQWTAGGVDSSDDLTAKQGVTRRSLANGTWYTYTLHHQKSTHCIQRAENMAGYPKSLDFCCSSQKINILAVTPGSAQVNLQRCVCTCP